MTCLFKRVNKNEQNLAFSIDAFRQQKQLKTQIMLKFMTLVNRFNETNYLDI